MNYRSKYNFNNVSYINCIIYDKFHCSTVHYPTIHYSDKLFNNRIYRIKGFMPHVYITRCNSDLILMISLLSWNTTMVLTAEDVWSEGAAGDPQVVGIFLCMELVHVQVPQTQVSIGGAGHEQLTARAEGAGYHCCVIHCSGPSQTKPTAAASTNMPVSTSTSLLLFKYDNAGWSWRIVLANSGVRRVVCRGFQLLCIKIWETHVLCHFLLII